VRKKLAILTPVPAIKSVFLVLGVIGAIASLSLAGEFNTVAVKLKPLQLVQKSAHQLPSTSLATTNHHQFNVSSVIGDRGVIALLLASPKMVTLQPNTVSVGFWNLLKLKRVLRALKSWLNPINATILDCIKIVNVWLEFALKTA
jgi:hypothetical protein